MLGSLRLVGSAILAAASAGCIAAVVPTATRTPEGPRRALIQRAHVWQPTNVSQADLRRGPQAPDAFLPGQRIECDFVSKELEGNSPKFVCRTDGGDELKVKFGGTNGEVYGEVLATRLLWALGFPADRMYPVSVVCRGCPAEYNGITRPDGGRRFAPAVVERKWDNEWEGEPAGWTWQELDFVDEEQGGAPREHRDALKLLAVMIQHTDSKPQQQRIVCMDATPACRQPLLMLNDVGLTFGRAHRLNDNATGAVNLTQWRRAPVWKDGPKCIGNLPKSLTGTLDDPIVSEEGRQFLAGLLIQLSDRQLHELFDVANVRLRLREPGRVRSGFATVPEWVDAFREKRRQVIEQRCA